VKWSDSGEQELFGGANPDEEDDTAKSPRTHEKMGTIQQKKRQYEQLKLDQRQIRLFQGTHFPREKPNQQKDEDEKDQKRDDRKEGSGEHGRSLTIVNEATAEQNDTRSQVSGSRQPEQEGDFIS
jgi:hypothetical protein